MSSFTFQTATDNHNPSRAYAAGTLSTGQGAEGKTTVLEWAEGQEPKGSQEAVYLLDTGSAVQVLYVAGWFPAGHAEAGKLFLQAFPTNHIGADGQPVDFGNWQLGPRKAFHLKASITEGAESSADPWQHAREHFADYEDWRYEVRNQETLLSFAAWLASRQQG